MNRLLVTGMAMVLASASASAADMAAQAPITKAAAAVAYDWTGIYAGGYWGTSLGQSSATTPGGFADAADISKAIKEQFGVALDKKTLDIPNSLRAIGELKVKAKICKGVDAAITVEVQAEEA